MTPAERIAALMAEWFDGEIVEQCTDEFLDALCPKGERVVLDRTDDTDRLVKQREVPFGPSGRILGMGPFWLDVDIDGAS